MQPLRQNMKIDALLELFPGMADKLPDINKALRNINFGKMDYLPYDQPVDGYQLAMRADLIPQGHTKPPSMGHWQIEVSRTGKTYRLLLQGKADKGQELAEIVFLCGPCEESAQLLGGPSEGLDSR